MEKGRGKHWLLFCFMTVLFCWPCAECEAPNMNGLILEHVPHNLTHSFTYIAKWTQMFFDKMFVSTSLHNNLLSTVQERGLKSISLLKRKVKLNLVMFSNSKHRMINKNIFKYLFGDVEMKEVKWVRPPNSGHVHMMLNNIRPVPLLFEHIFYVDKHLKLNISVEHISIVAGYLSTCELGYFALWPFICYCGFHANVLIFPESNNSTLATLFSHLATCYLKYSFSVSDNNGIVSTQTQRPFQPKFLVTAWNLKLLKSGKKVQYSHVQVGKFNKIRVLSKASAHLFDGPGTKSPHVLLHNSVFLTTTFQCVLYEFLESNQSTNLNVQWIRTQESTKVIELNSSENNILISNALCKSGLAICVFEVLVSQNHTVNVSVFSMKDTSHRNNLCHFAGVSISMNTTAAGELALLCSQQMNNLRHKSVFAASPQIYIMLYYFREYTTFNVSTKVSFTKCHVVKFNLCEYYWECQTQRCDADHRRFFYRRAPTDTKITENCVVHQFFHELTEGLLPPLRKHRVQNCYLPKWKPPFFRDKLTTIEVFGHLRGKMCYFFSERRKEVFKMAVAFLNDQT